MSFYDATKSSPITVVVGKAGSGKTTLAFCLQDVCEIHGYDTHYIQLPDDDCLKSFCNADIPLGGKIIVIDEVDRALSFCPEDLLKVIEFASTGNCRLIFITQKFSELDKLLSDYNYVLVNMTKHIKSS